ncbi:MAG: hypothetical protein JWP95_531, partial [Actinotalea sp.]|nr:hypothetical protein [Actinotalea sp.]
VGEAFSAIRRWPRLGGGSTRTAMGQALVTRLRWGVGRIAALTHLAPPMTPAADAVGLPREHLEPDDVDRDPDEPG